MSGLLAINLPSGKDFQGFGQSEFTKKKHQILAGKHIWPRCRVTRDKPLRVTCSNFQTGVLHRNINIDWIVGLIQLKILVC